MMQVCLESVQQDILNKRCSKHPKQPCEFIHFSQTSQQRRICSKCAFENNYTLKEIFSIRDLIDSDNTTLMLDNFPPLNQEDQHRHLRFGKIEEFQSQINTFLNNLTSDFLNAIEKLRKEAKERSAKRSETESKLSQACKEMSYLEQLKQAIFSTKTQQQQDRELEEIIQNAWKNKTQNSMKFQKIINEFNSWNNSLEQSILLAKEIIKKVSDIQFFSNAIDLLPKTQLIKSSYSSSKQLQVAKTSSNNYLTVENILAYTNFGEVFLDFTINPSEKYIINIDLQQVGGQDRNFLFGLGLDSTKNNYWWYTQKTCFCPCPDNYGVNKQVKGPSISADLSNSQERFSFEVRIYLKEKFFRVGSLPNYESVVEINNQDNIDLKQQYVFFIFLGNSQNIVTITKLQTVLEFDDKFN